MEGVSRAMSILRPVRACLALAALTSAALLAGPGAALADCLAPPPVEESIKAEDIVVVGTVTEVSNGGRWASVRVDEIWRGPDLPGNVLIKGGPDANAASSVDRTFETGVQYLFFPIVGTEPGRDPLPGEPASLLDSMCTNTQPLTAEIATLRPADARTPQLSNGDDLQSFDLGFVVGIGGVVLLVGAVMLGVGLLARGRSD